MFKVGDDMDCLSTLMNLSEQLSIANDTIAEDPNLVALLQELVTMLERSYIPELVISTLQCINYILDINPAFTSILKKCGGIPRIIILMSTMDDSTCLENVVKAIEKISYENAQILLENNAFESLLNIMDFLPFNFRKSFLKACLNMAANTTNFEVYSKFIQPSIPTLTVIYS